RLHPGGQPDRPGNARAPAPDTVKMTDTNTTRRAEPMDSSQPETDASAAPPIAPLAIATREHTETTATEVVFDLRDLDVYYGRTLAVEGVSMKVYKNVITAMIGPSGCGKSTVVRTLNRMNDPIPKSIFDNVAWAPRILGLKSDLNERVEKALRGAALWDEVKDRLKGSAL